MSDALLDLRALRTELRLKEDDLAKVGDILKNHPAKPLPGDDIERVTRWIEIKEPLERRRQDIIKDVRDLNAEISNLRNGLNQRPLNGRTLSQVIERLVKVEAIFSTEGKEAAWDALTDLTDWLEALEESK